jgi:peptidylprolyl isomerase
MHLVNIGDRVRIQYFCVGKPTAGVRRPARHAVEFTAGSNDMVRTLSWGVVGMSQGQCRQFTLLPSESLGIQQPRRAKEFPRYRFPKQIRPTVGQRLSAVHRLSGRRRRVTVIEVTPYSVVVDGNHPLAGQAVVVEIIIISVDSSANANVDLPQFDLGGES